MSQIVNRVITEYRAYGSQAIAQSRNVAGGMRQIGQVVDENTRASEKFAQQWRAIGTTVRYAIAGGVIFGLRGMVTQLKDVQVQMGLIAATGSQPGGGIFGQPFSTTQVNRLGFGLQQAAVNSITPINQMNDATVNLLSTVQNIDPGKIPKIMEILAEGAQLAQTPVTDLTQAVTSMNNAFGRPQNLQTISQVTRQWQALIKIAPGVLAAAPQIAQQLGPLSQVALLGASPNVSPKLAQSQLFTLALGSLRFGGTPASNIRGLQYFIQSLAQPTSKGATQILHGMGITPQFVHQRGFYASALRFLRQISMPRGGARAIRQMGQLSEDQMSDMDQSGASLPGIPPDQMARLRTALGRVHAVRAAVTLAFQLRQRGNIQSLQQVLDAMQGVRDDQTQFAQSWANFRKRAKLQTAANAMNVLSLQVAQTLEPLLNMGAGLAVGAQHAAHRHPRAVRYGVYGALGATALLATRRMLGGRGGGLLGMFGQGAVTARAGEALISGGGGKTVMNGLGNSPANPLYVVVVGNLFKQGGGPGGLGGKIENEVKKKAPWFAPFAAFGSRVGLTAGARSFALKAAALGLLAEQTPMLGDALRMESGQTFEGQKLVHRQWYNYLSPGSGVTEKQWRMSRAEHIRNAWNPNNPAHVSQLFKTAIENINGKAYVTMDVNLQHPGGKVERKVIHVPMDLWGKTGLPPSGKGNSRSGNRSR
jgi:hypothetical protein